MRKPQSFYNVEVTSAELWQAVGNILERRRREQKWRPSHVERAGGPSYKTVQLIEAGTTGHVESLDKHARALGLSIVDVLTEALHTTAAPLSPEAAYIVRCLGLMSVEGRAAMTQMANALTVRREAGPSPDREPGPPSGPTAVVTPAAAPAPPTGPPRNTRRKSR